MFWIQNSTAFMSCICELVNSKSFFTVKAPIMRKIKYSLSAFKLLLHLLVLSVKAREHKFVSHIQHLRIQQILSTGTINNVLGIWSKCLSRKWSKFAVWWRPTSTILSNKACQMIVASIGLNALVEESVERC